MVSGHHRTTTRRPSVLRALLAAAACALAAGGIHASGLSEDEVKASFVLNLTHFITWPEPAEADSEFVIGILGETTLEPHLRKSLHDRSAGRRPLALETFRSLEEAGWQSCEILVVGGSMHDDLNAVLAGVSERTLTVSDLPQFAASGGHVGLAKRGRRVALEIRRELIGSSRFKVSSQLVRVAKMVD